MINSNISFIVPSWHYYSDPLKHQPYWELYYATLLKKRGYKVDIYDLRKNKKNTLEETVKFIPEKKFYFFWIFKTGDAQEIYSIVSLLKKKYKNSICVAGGTHVDMCQDECKNFFDSIISQRFLSGSKQVHSLTALFCKKEVVPPMPAPTSITSFLI